MKEIIFKYKVEIDESELQSSDEFQGDGINERIADLYNNSDPDFGYPEIIKNWTLMTVTDSETPTYLESEITNDAYQRNIKSWNQIFAMMEAIRIKDRSLGITDDDIADLRYFVNKLTSK